MKKILLTLLMLLFMTGCGTNGNIKSPLIVGLDISPVGYVDEKGEVVRFEVDLAREAIKRAGSRAEFNLLAREFPRLYRRRDESRFC